MAADKTTHNSSSMTNIIRYESIRVHMLKVNEHPTWRVKMAILSATHIISYYDGLYKTTKLVVAVGDTPKKLFSKEKKYYTAEDQTSVMKYAKVRHIG